MLAGAFSGRVALASHQTKPYVAWLVDESGNCHAQGACRIRQAGMGANAAGPFETVIFHVMVNVYMEGNRGTSTANVGIRDQISGRAALTSH